MSTGSNRLDDCPSQIYVSSLVRGFKAHGLPNSLLFFTYVRNTLSEGRLS